MVVDKMTRKRSRSAWHFHACTEQSLRRERRAWSFPGLCIKTLPGCAILLCSLRVSAACAIKGFLEVTTLVIVGPVAEGESSRSSAMNVHHSRPSFTGPCQGTVPASGWGGRSCWLARGRPGGVGRTGSINAYFGMCVYTHIHIYIYIL